MQQHLATLTCEIRYNSTYTQWLDNPDAGALTLFCLFLPFLAFVYLTHSGRTTHMQQHLHTVAIEPRQNSTYPQWLDSPDAAALARSGY